MDTSMDGKISKEEFLVFMEQMFSQIMWSSISSLSILYIKYYEHIIYHEHILYIFWKIENSFYSSIIKISPNSELSTEIDLRF